MLINRNELKAQMVRKHITREELALNLGISKRSLSYKIFHNKDFKEEEICKLISLFGSTIFFDFFLCVIRAQKGKEEKK